MKSKAQSVQNPFHSLAIVILFLVSFCVILPIICLIRMIYTRSIGQFEKSLIQTNMTETRSYADLTGQELQTIRTQTYDVLANRVVSAIPTLFETGVQDTRLALELNTVQSHLQAIQNSHNIIDSMVIYYPKLYREITYSSQSLYGEEEKERISNIIVQSRGSNLWIDGNRLIYWNAKPFHSNTQYETSSAIIVSSITFGELSQYLKKYQGADSNSQFALAVSKEGKTEFLAATDHSFDSLAFSGNQNDISSYRFVEVNQNRYLLTWVALDNSEMIFCRLTPFNQIVSPLNEYKRAMILFAVVLIFSAILFTTLLYIMIYKPIAHARHIFSKMESGDLSVRMGKAWYREFQNMYCQFDSMSAHVQYLIEQEYQLRLLNSKAQMKQLQYQISPHFLYNTYFILRGFLQEEEYEKATLLSGIIGRYLKYITVSDSDTATLGEELEHAEAYAQIQQIRFAKRVCVRFDPCPEEWKKLTVPRLIIQPLIENAFDHGIRDKIQGGLIQVGLSYLSDMLTIMVEDDGESLTDEKLAKLTAMLSQKELLLKDSVALCNIHKRLTLMYPSGSGLFISRSPLGGLRCVLKIIYTESDRNA